MITWTAYSVLAAKKYWQTLWSCLEINGKQDTKMLKKALKHSLIIATGSCAFLLYYMWTLKPTWKKFKKLIEIVLMNLILINIKIILLVVMIDLVSLYNNNEVKMHFTSL